MAIGNPSFEDPITATSPGYPDQWADIEGGSSWEFAVFVSTAIAAETFESGWLANEGRRTEFGSGELDDSTFDTTYPEALEDFEEEWSSNEDRRDEFGASQLDDASFDTTIPEAFEDWEEEWSSNEDRRTVFGGGELDNASFDTGTPEAIEDFEEEWSDNEDRRTVFGGGELDNAAFANGGGTTPIEAFEVGLTLVVPAGTGIGAASTLDPTLANRVVFGGTLSASLELQYRRDGFASWETWDTISSVPATVLLPAGISEVRIERLASGGTTSAAILWPLLTEL